MVDQKGEELNYSLQENDKQWIFHRFNKLVWYIKTKDIYNLIHVKVSCTRTEHYIGTLPI